MTKLFIDWKAKDGKSEYTKGLIKIQLSDKEEGCKYLDISSQKIYRF